MLKFSQETAELDKAMRQVASQKFDAVRNTQGFNYKYPQLFQIVDLVGPALKDAGLVDFVIPASLDGQPAVTYRLLHDSGQWMESTVPIGPAMGGKTPMQDLGGAITYMARYFRVNVWGVLVWDEDAAPKREKEKKGSTKDKIISMIESVGDVDSLVMQFKQYKGQAESEGWLGELEGLCKVRKAELLGE